jgi:hypothetical protein
VITADASASSPPIEIVGVVAPFVQAEAGDAGQLEVENRVF